MSNPNLSLLPPQQAVPTGSGGGDDGFTYRLQAVENDIREIKQDLRDINTRLHAVEADLKVITERLTHMPTKAGILAGVVSSIGGGMAIAAGVASVILRLLPG